MWSELAAALRALASKSCFSRRAQEAPQGPAGSKDLDRDNASVQRQGLPAPEQQHTQQHTQQDFALSAKAEKIESKVESKVASKVAKAALLLSGAAAVSLSMPSSMPSCSGASAPGAKTKAEGIPVPASAPGAETTAEKQGWSSSGRGGQKATDTPGRAVDAHAMSHAKGTLPGVKPKTGCDIEAGAAPAASAGRRMQTRAHFSDNSSKGPADEISPSQMETAKKDGAAAKQDSGAAACSFATNARGERSGQRSEAKRSLDLEALQADATSAKRRRMRKK